MILDTHYNWFLDYYVNSSWANPSLETNITITPTLLNHKFPTYGSFDFMRNVYKLPHSDVAYDLYTLNYVPPSVFRSDKRKVGQWISVADFCQLTNTILYIGYVDSLQTTIYSQSHLLHLYNGTTILAVPSINNKIRGKIRVSIRSSNDDLNNRVTIKETHMTSANLIFWWLSDYENDEGRSYKQYYLNGVPILKPSKDLIEIGDFVTTFEDTGIAGLLDFDLVDLPVYVKDDINYYLVRVSDDTSNKFINRRDITYYLHSGGDAKRLLLLDEDLKQITDNEVGIRTSTLESLMSQFKWIESNTKLRVYTKESNPNQFYTNNENYLYSLNALPTDLRIQALVGSIDAPQVLLASTLHDSAVNRGYETEYHKFDKALLDSVTEVSTWDYYINRVQIQANNIDNDLIDITSVPNGTKVFASFINGYLEDIEPTSKVDEVDILTIGHNKETEILEGNGVSITGMKAHVVYSKIQDEVTTLCLGDDYAIINDEVRVKSGFGDIYTLDLNTTTLTTLDVERTVFDLPVISFGDKLGTYTVYGDNKTLVPGIDYVISKGRIAISYWAKFKRLVVLFQPNLAPDKELIEVGFTRNNTVSINDTYLEVDPNNTILNVGGRVMFPNDVEWDIPYKVAFVGFDNAMPYAITKSNLSCSDLSAVELMRHREEYHNNLRQIAEFKDNFIPKPEAKVSIYRQQYRLVSVFMYEVLKAAAAGAFDYRASTIAALGLDYVLRDYLYLLEDKLDITTQDIEWNVIELRAHPFEIPVAVNGDLYNLVKKINSVYLGDRIFLNSNFRITA